MPEMDGITFAEKALTICDLPIILYTGQGSEEVAQAAFAAGVSDYFRKEMDPSHYQVLEKRIIGVITRDRAVKELIYSETRYHEMFDNATQCVAVYKRTDDGDFAFVDFNHAAEKVEKIGKEDLLGKKVTEVFPGVREMGMFDVLTRVYETGVPEHLDSTFYKDDRRAGWRRSYVYRLPTGEVVNLYEDTTEEHMLKELQERHRLILENMGDMVWLMDLSLKPLWISPSSTQMSGYTLEEVQSLPPEKIYAPSSLLKIEETIRSSIRELRRTIANLRFQPLVQLGLIGALNQCLIRNDGIDCQFSVHGKPIKLSMLKEGTIYWAAQEMVTNVCKHASASKINLQLHYCDGTVSIRATDNGLGFNVDEVMKNSISLGRLGLFGMKERVELLGGSLVINSCVGEGTTVLLTLPVLT